LLQSKQQPCFVSDVTLFRYCTIYVKNTTPEKERRWIRRKTGVSNATQDLQFFYSWLYTNTILYV